MEMESNGLKWYVVRTKPCKEDFAELQLLRGNFEVFNPKIKSLSKQRGNGHFTLKPFFPGYIFVHSDFDNPYYHHMVKYTRGVSKILGNEYPISIKNEIIRLIKERANGGTIIEQNVIFKAGRWVRIRRGPFRDLIGVLERPPGPTGRVRVLLDIVWYSAHVDCHWTEIERM
jgi:transcriptional antiterminator NusG